jgi:hypothetical protein
VTASITFWRYIHDHDREHLVAVIQPPTDEAPTGAVTHYEYDTAEAHGQLRHNLLRIIGSDGCAKVENGYGKDPTSDDFARLIDQRYAEHYAAYRTSVLSTRERVPAAINLPALQVESVIDGDYRVETFNFRGGRLEERFRLARDGSYRLVAEVYRYDERGNLILHRRPNGMTTHYLHATLPDGDEAEAICDKLVECELRIISQTARTRAGLIAQINLLKSWIEEDESTSRDVNLAAAATLMAGIFEWASGTLGTREPRS